jgi:hypothetical protein
MRMIEMKIKMIVAAIAVLFSITNAGATDHDELQLLCQSEEEMIEMKKLLLSAALLMVAPAKISRV